MITNLNFSSNNQLILENNLATNLRWLILVGQVFGAAPISINMRPSLNNKKQSSNYNLINLMIIWAHYVWTIFLIVLILASMVSRFIEDGYTFSISRFLDLIEYFFNIVNSITIMYSCNYNREWYRKYLIQFIEIDLKLKRAGDISKECLVQRFLRICGTLTVIYFICAIVTDGLLRNFVVFKLARSLAAYLLPNVIVVLSVFQYCCILLALQERFAKINGVLLRLLVEYRRTFDWDYQLKGSVLAIVSRSSDVLPKEILISLRGIFNELSVMHKNGNTLFGWLIVALAASNFVIVCTQLFTLYRFAKDSAEFNIFLLTYSVLWILLHSGRIIGVLYLNTRIEEEVTLLEFCKAFIDFI